MSFTDRAILWLHIGVAIFTIGPVTMAIMSTPRYIRKRNTLVVGYLHRTTRIYGIASLLVFVFGAVLAGQLGDFSKPWISISMTLFIVAMVLLYIAGASLGVSLSAATWLIMSGLVLLGLVPIAALGVALGHLVREDAISPAIGGGVSLLAFLGGTWFPIVGDGWFVQLCKLLPSYWLVQAGHVGLGGTKNPWGLEGWLVIAFWAAVLISFAIWAYRRDTKRA